MKNEHEEYLEFCKNNDLQKDFEEFDNYFARIRQKKYELSRQALIAQVDDFIQWLKDEGILK
jgi:hypothetical protein